jgi:ABC-type dipeptide/oligopeptide/nickel transport system ATPase component
VPRCAHARTVCRQEYPPVVAAGHDDGHRAACWKVAERWDG